MAKKPDLKVVPANDSDDNKAHFFVDGKEVSSEDYNKVANASEETSSNNEDIATRSEELSAVLRDEGSTVAERSEARKELNELSKQAGEARKGEIAKIKDEDERKVIELYEQGEQTYAIAKKVYKFVNQDTVGQVTLYIRKHYADDYNAVEDVNSTKGYTGV